MSAKIIYCRPENIKLTGIYDRNKIEIKEGDIIVVDGRYLRYVLYSEATNECVTMRLHDGDTECMGPIGIYKVATLEVIGNIYDNYYLLEDNNNAKR